MDNNLADKVVADIQRDFRIVGSSRVHGWYAWAIVGIVFGMALGMVYVANRSGQFIVSRGASDDSFLLMGNEPAEKGLTGDFVPENPYFATDAADAGVKPVVPAVKNSCSASDISKTASGEATTELPAPSTKKNKTDDEIEKNNELFDLRGEVASWFNHNSHELDSKDKDKGTISVDGTGLFWKPPGTPGPVKDTLKEARDNCTANLPSAETECGKICDTKACSSDPAIDPEECSLKGSCSVTGGGQSNNQPIIIKCTVSSPYVVSCSCKNK